MAKLSFYLLMAAAVFASFAGIVYGVKAGNLWVGLVPILISPCAMLVIRVLAEDGRPKGLFSLTTQSWAFLFGDTLALPLAFLAAAWSWRRLAPDGWYTRSLWLVMAIAIGLLVAVGWRLLEVRGYTTAGYADLLGSPSKLWHDLVVYPVLGSTLVWAGIPAMVYDFRYTGWLVVMGVVVWVALGVLDNTVHHLDPADLHPPVQYTFLR